jgi:hypothetical protein
VNKKNTEVQEFRSSGVQEFRSSGVQEFRSSGVQEFRSSGERCCSFGDTLDELNLGATESEQGSQSPTREEFQWLLW